MLDGRQGTPYAAFAVTQTQQRGAWARGGTFEGDAGRNRSEVGPSWRAETAWRRSRSGPGSGSVQRLIKVSMREPGPGGAGHGGAIVEAATPQRVSGRRLGRASYDRRGFCVRRPRVLVICGSPPGVYRESLVLGKSVVITADENAVEPVELTSPGRGPRSSSALGPPPSGVWTVRGDDPAAVVVAISGGAPRLTECSITGGRVEVSGTATPVLSGTTIRNSTTIGLYLLDTAQATVNDCVIEEIDGTGLLVVQSASAVLAASRIAATTGDGVWLRETAKADLTDCDISRAALSGLVTEDKASLRCGSPGARRRR